MSSQNVVVLGGVLGCVVGIGRALFGIFVNILEDWNKTKPFRIKDLAAVWGVLFEYSGILSF